MYRPDWRWSIPQRPGVSKGNCGVGGGCDSDDTAVGEDEHACTRRDYGETAYHLSFL